MEAETIETVTIFRTWVEIAAALPDTDKGKLYHALCEYSLCGREPQLPGVLSAYFTLMRPSIDKSNKRKLAQHKKEQKRRQNRTQSDVQSDVQNASQSGVQSDVQSDVQNMSQSGVQSDVTHVRKTETGTEKKSVSKDTLKENSVFPFENFWQMYGKKRNRKRCMAKYKSIPETSRAEIKAALPSYIAATPDRQFRADPLTYLNGERWQDEVITPGVETKYQGVF